MPRKVHDGLKKRCDCAKRRWASCPHPWWFSFCHESREYRFSLAKFTTTADGSMSKTEAETLRDRLRGEIRAGQRTTTGDLVATPDPTAPLTVADIIAKFMTWYAGTPGRRATAIAKVTYRLRQLDNVMVDGANAARVPLTAKPMRDVVKADIEAIREARRAALVAGREASVRLAEDAALPERERMSADERKRLTGLATAAKRADKGGAVSTNRLLAVFRRVCSWAVAEGYLTGSPFKRGGETIVKLDTAVEYARSRRLTGDEDTRLLAAASPHLRACIECALSTGMRVGEILGLRWADVRCDVTGTPRELVLPATTTKTGRTRVLPVGARLRAVLAMRRTDPAGQDFPPTAFVFGNEVGERIGSIKTAWVATCRRAGISGLRFHDLRRSFACSLLESGAGLHDVRDFLGHTDITTTSKYLAATPVRLRAALDRMESADRSDGKESTPSHAAPLVN